MRSALFTNERTTVTLSHFQWPPCVLQTKPVLLHFEHVNLPKMPEARPPLQAWQSCSGRWHFVHFMSSPIRVQTLGSANLPTR